MPNRTDKRASLLAKALEEEIATGRLEPGTRLEEVGLAERFGVSRTPIREALLLLTASGLVDLRPRRGAVVASLSIERLLEMFEVMAEIEATCARLAAIRMTDTEREALQRQHHECGQVSTSGDSDRYYEENAKFHAMIYAGAHNSFLTEEVQRLRRRLQPYRRLQLRLEGRIEASFSEHTDVTNAIVGGDGDAAADCMRKHVAIQGDRFGTWLSAYGAGSAKMQAQA
ncbi:MAG: GntR family transcriptional regulator [Alphaproteobacteria bacterium]|nr:GntR family transcriptional regulator [Alphaproteobacteria bacterium]